MPSVNGSKLIGLLWETLRSLATEEAIVTGVTKKPTISESNIAEEMMLDENKIRMRAYQVYEERGKEDGRDLDDWLKAEEEIRRAVRGVAA